MQSEVREQFALNQRLNSLPGTLTRLDVELQNQVDLVLKMKVFSKALCNFAYHMMHKRDQSDDILKFAHCIMQVLEEASVTEELATMQANQKRIQEIPCKVKKAPISQHTANRRTTAQSESDDDEY